MLHDELIREYCDGTLRLVLSRPDSRNALTDTLCHALFEACAEAAVDPKVRVVVLTGRGKTFCAGGDVKAMAGSLAPPPFYKRGAEMRRFVEASKLLHEMPKPTVALIQGAAAGAGLSLALACDFRLCLPTAKFTTAFAKVGLSGDYGGSYFMQRTVGAARARELYMLSPVITADEALRIGLVTEVVDEDSFEDESKLFIRNLAGGPTVAYGYIKKNLNAGFTDTLDEVLEAEVHRHLSCKETMDHMEAARAFVEKRAPVFRGE